MAKVKSNAIAEINYDPETKTMQVTFTSGKSYRYDGVDPAQHQYIMGAESVGRAFNTIQRNEGWVGTPVTEE